ncbi:MAG: PSD1 domain-containing protein [Chloroflexi bacterium]|nr:PSD1 domain-containing protein [Chloroflexota bacterium]
MDRQTLLLAFALLVPLRTGAASAGSKGADFNREIRPILSQNCLQCHGPDEKKRKAKLRLDIREQALSDLGGHQAIKPKDLAASALWQRINATDPDDLMPPPETGKKLTPAQIALLKRWIEEGAKYQGHWSFVPPARPELPKVKNLRWPRNGIDYFIGAGIEAHNLTPSPEAPKEVLIRRVTFDLTGLPPTPAEVDTFLSDREPGAYDRLVDRLLQSPRYGEHQARFWLDAARYGDTHGLHLDNERSMWPYRDWVVAAFNRNLPFDQFTIEQLAGDLLPEPTQQQLVASGFNRCNVSTSEGGAIDEEFYVRYAVDRVETTSTVWLGLTAGCAVCHDHKFDPISQKEFYQLFGFFNSLTEKAMDGNALLPPPVLKLFSPEQKKQMEEFDGQIERIGKRIREEVAKINYAEPPPETVAPAASPGEVVWVDDELPPGAKAGTNKDTSPLQWVEAEKERVYSGKRALLRSDKGLAQDYFTEASQPLFIGEGDKLFAYVFLDAANPPKAIMLQYHTRDWLHRANWGDEDAIDYGEKGTSSKVLLGPLPTAGQWVRLEIETAKLGLKPGAKLDGMAFAQFGGTVYWDKAGLVTATTQKDLSGVSQLVWERMEKAKDKSGLPKSILDALKVEPAKRTPEQKESVASYYLENIYAAARPVFDPLHGQLKEAKARREEFDKSVPSTMVMQEQEKPREAFILKRGEYDKKGAPVTRGVPAVLPPLPKSPTTNRLDLARWLTDPKHPLTARVTVNRFWQQFFGTGIVKTANDFGSQGEWPSHPELLDWLATEFVASGWNIKQMHRLLVTSAAYRQSSRATPQELQADPDNRLLSRGPRFRLDAEMLRDNALYVGGLLNEKMGGHGVKPYQPPGIWEAVAYTTSNTAKYQQDSGEALYRRSLYTFWKRTAPPPFLVTFDAPSRESCSVRRERTNTPLQALLLMNDPQYVEAARHLGAHLITDGGYDAAQRLSYGFRLVTARRPNPTERAVLLDTFEKYRAKYQKDPEAAQQIISVGESPVNSKLNKTELAAYTMVANLLLNLDETVTKP